MPLPRPPVGGWDSPEQVDAAYKELGWNKEIIFEWVSYNQAMRTWVVSTYRANNVKFPCNCETGARFVYLTFTPSGIVKTCAICRTTHGTLSFDDDRGRTLMILLSQRAVTEQDAVAVVQRTGQRKPALLGRPEDDRLAHARKLIDLHIEHR